MVDMYPELLKLTILENLVTYVVKKSSIQKLFRRLYKDIGFICFDRLPPPPNKDIKNKDILLNYLTPSLLPKIRTYEPFVFGFKKHILHF